MRITFGDRASLSFVVKGNSSLKMENSSFDFKICCREFVQFGAKP